MADSRQDKNKEKKEPNSEGLGFKRVMGGFDQNEVNLYINKLKKQMAEQQAEAERRISNLQTNLEDANRENEKAREASKKASSPEPKDNSAETKQLLDKIKAENDKKIMELRKSILDERRNVAKFDKECAMAKMSEKKIREEFDKLKSKYDELKKNAVSVSAQKPVTTHNADKVLDEASAFAEKLISAAKKYADDTVRAADKYKTDVEAELKLQAQKINDVKKKLDEQIKQTEREQSESAAKIKDITAKIGSVSSLFDSFASQFSSMNSQISGVTGKIDDICRQFTETTDQIGSVAKQITDTTTQINSVSEQINSTTSQINTFAKSISDTTDKINEASRQMSDTSSKITETTRAMTETSELINRTSRQMTETTSQINETSQKINGFTESLTTAKDDIAGISKIVADADGSISDAKQEMNDTRSAVDIQASSADLSAISRIGKELSFDIGNIKSKLILPVFDESLFSKSKFDEIKNKFRIETVYETSEVPASNIIDDDDDIADFSSISSEPELSADKNMEENMSETPDIAETSIFEKDSLTAEPKQPKEETTDKTDRPGIGDDFTDFFTTPSRDDNLSGDIPLINMEGVGVDDDFTLEQAPEPITDEYDITPIDKTLKPEKGNDLGADIFDLAINPSENDDDLLANMMEEAHQAEIAANKDLSAEDFETDNSVDEFADFADLFAQGSSQTAAAGNNGKSMFNKPASDDPWDFGDDTFGDDSDLSSDSDLADLLMTPLS